MKITRSNYMKDKYYSKVTSAVDQLLKDRFVIAPFEVLIQMGYLTKENYETWRFGRIPYLERVIMCNLSKTNRIMRILRLHAEDRGFRPSSTVYKKWGKGKKILIRFSKSGNPAIENLYSTSYVTSSEANRQSDKSVPALDKTEREILESYENEEWSSVENLESEKLRYEEIARYTIQKNKRINIRISERDLNRIKLKAIEEGVPYQTLISSVLHKYVSGRFVEKN